MVSSSNSNRRRSLRHCSHSRRRRRCYNTNNSSSMIALLAVAAVLVGFCSCRKFSPSALALEVNDLDPDDVEFEIPLEDIDQFDHSEHQHHYVNELIENENDPVFLKAMEFRSFLKHIFHVVDSSLEYADNLTTQERVIISALMEYIHMDPFLFGKKLKEQDGNWMAELHSRTTQLAPPEFFHVWDEEPPTMHEINIVVTIDDEAAELSQKPGPDGQLFVDEDVLIGKAFLPFRHRGYTATLLDTFCRVVLGPLKSVAYAIPSNQNIQTIAKYAPLIEVGAGTGYWSAVLQQQGVDISPYDERPPKMDDKENVYFYHTYTNVQPGTCLDIMKDATQDDDIPNKTLLIVWPNNPDNVDNSEVFHSDRLPATWDAECLEAYIAAGGTTVIFVGEREENIHLLPGAPADSGLCATRKFQSLLREKFDLVEQEEILKWYYSDDLTVWKLKKEKDEL